MKKYFIVVLLVVGFGSIGLSQGIKFHHDISLNEAFDKARQENKLIFIDAYTTWCGPCKYLSKNIFTQQSVGDYYNDNFINVKINMEKAPVGPQVDAKYSIRAYPSLLFVNSNGKLVHKVEGAGDANYVLNIAKVAQKKAGISVNSNSGNVKSDYSFAFKYVESNKTDAKAWSDYIKKAISYFNSGKASSVDMNNGCWFIYENHKTFNDISSLKLAKEWSKKTIDLESSNAYNYDTYAHILFDLGYINDAITYEEMALKKAVQNNDNQSDIDFYKKELSKFKSR